MLLTPVSRSQSSRRNTLTAAAALLAFAVSASAQVGTNYSFTQAAGVYTPITGGTQIAVATTAVTLDDNTYALTLPFGFTYDGTTHTAVSVQTNGFLTFGATSPATTYTPLSGTLTVSGVVSACGRDLQGGYVFTGDRTLGSDQLVNVSSNGPLQVGDVITGTGIATGTTIVSIVGNTITMSANATATSAATAVTAYGPWSEMRYETQGTAPNQVFVVQWSGFRRYSTTLTTTKDTTLNFQIRLHEATGAIEVVYGNCAPGATTTTTALHQVGIRGATTTFPADVNNRLNTKGVNDDWSLSVPGTANTSGMLFNGVTPANVIPSGLTYTWQPNPGVPATNTIYGSGCYDRPRASFYELLADATVASTALTGQSMVMLPVGNEYLASWGGGTYVAPSGAAVALAITDDGEVLQALSTGFPTPSGTVTNIMVHGNGLVTFGSTTQTFGGANNYTPTAAGFLPASQTALWSWHDYNASESGSGAIKYEEAFDANSDLIAYVTWDGVENYPTGVLNPSTMQFQLTLTGANAGRVTMVWQSIDSSTASTFGTAHLVGYSPGGANLDPGSITLATALPVLTAPDVYALALSASNTAVLGTTVVYTTSNIPAAAVVSAQLISFGQINPGIDLGFMGAPGCLQLVDLNVAATTLLFGSPSATYSFGVPNDPGMAGLPLNVQSATLDMTANALGLITSNGIRTIVGDF